jgi:hypothetical protein
VRHHSSPRQPAISEPRPRASFGGSCVETNWQIRYDTIGQLTAGRPVDLIVTFMVGEMKRVPPKAVAAALGAFFGTDEWRTLKRRMQVDLVELYRKQLAKLDYLPIVPRAPCADVRPGRRPRVPAQHAAR